MHYLKPLISLCLAALAAALPLALSAQPPPAPASPNALEQISDALTQLVRSAQPNVVTIQTKPRDFVLPHLPAPLSQQERAALSPEKRAVYDAQMERAAHEVLEFVETAKALLRTAFTGSGFEIAGGFIVTTAEVAERIEEPTVSYADGRRVEVLWINSDSESNIAVMKIAGPTAAGLPWADSAALDPGAVAVAMGSQGDFPRSVSLGIVSGLGRAGRSGRRRYENLIQFQGAVGAGSSGGPLLNARGEVVGMIVAAPADVFAAPRFHLQREGHKPEHGTLESPSAVPFSGLSNMGFALASNDIRPITDILCRGEKRPPGGVLGISLAPDTETPRPQIAGVLPDGPAAKAGLRAGDTILEINGRTFRYTAEFRAYAGRVAAGEALKITAQRGKETKTFSLTAQPRPERNGGHK